MNEKLSVHSHVILHTSRMSLSSRTKRSYSKWTLYVEKGRHFITKYANGRKAVVCVKSISQF